MPGEVPPTPPGIQNMKKWPTRSICEIADLSNGGTPPKANTSYWDGGTVPFVTAADLTGLYVSEARSHLTPTGLESGNTAVCEPGDLLIGTRTRVGNCAIAKVRMGASQDITRARLNPDCLPEFFRYYVAHVANELSFYSQGTSIQGITRDTLNELEIPVPPLAEQRRLVGRVEALTARLAQARQTRQAATAEAETLSTTFQRNTYERLLDEHDAIPLSEVGEVFSGCTPPKSRAEFWDGDVPWIAPKEMKAFRLGDSSVRLTQRAINDEVAKLLPSPAVLMVVRGMILARRVPIALTIRPVTINQDMKAFVPRKGIRADFLAHMLCGAGEELKGRVEVAGHGTCKLETDVWGSLPIPVPGNDVQRSVADKIDELWAKAGELGRLQAETAALLDSFTPALLAKAFRGEL
jgi:type I restriction enzyme S subunit